ncbi:hypothetical protein KBI33_03600 [Candidatus Shapirobacteria bacterium]|nr:hypothetical protein [Candidatus Shapirobacteria bacterium]
MKTWFSPVIFGNLLLVIASLILVFFFYSKLPPQVPLFYSQPRGRGQLASPSLLFILPGISFLILAVNFLISHFFVSLPFLREVLSWTAFLIAFLAFFTLSKIIFTIL